MEFGRPDMLGTGDTQACIREETRVRAIQTSNEWIGRNLHAATLQGRGVAIIIQFSHGTLSPPLSQTLHSLQSQNEISRC